MLPEFRISISGATSLEDYRSLYPTAWKFEIWGNIDVIILGLMNSFKIEALVAQLSFLGLSA